MDIIETDWGCANTYSDRIELNKHLREFPELRERVLRHELEHAKANSFFKNRKIDALTELKFKDLWPFYRKYPKAFLQQYFPVTYRNKTLYFEWSLIFLYCFYFCVGLLIFWIISFFSTDRAMFWKIVKYVILVLTASVIVRVGFRRLIKYINNQLAN